MSAEIVFFALLSGVAYCYFGYPLLLLAIGSFRRPSEGDTACEYPPVTLLIVAHNEEKVIGQKLKNSLALRYPEGRLEIVVASDASTDDTDKIVRSFGDSSIRLIRRPTRGSQTGAQNYAVPKTKGEIIVFSDANSMYHPDAIRQLVSSFSDPAVGAAVGRLRHSNAETNSVSFGEELYWRYESFLKRKQSAASALLFANGAIYAVRRSLYRPVHAEHDHDTIVPLRVAAEGFRVAYQPAAIAFEEALESFSAEFRRKIRIINRDAWTFLDLRFYLSPLRPWLAFNLISHKLLRWAVGFAMTGMFLSNCFLLDRPFFQVTMALQAAFYLLALLGFGLDRYGRSNIAVRIPLYFCLVNSAGMMAALTLLSRERIRTWTPRGW